MLLVNPCYRNVVLVNVLEAWLRGLALHFINMVGACQCTEVKLLLLARLGQHVSCVCCCCESACHNLCALPGLGFLFVFYFFF